MLFLGEDDRPKSQEFISSKSDIHASDEIKTGKGVGRQL